MHNSTNLAPGKRLLTIAEFCKIRCTNVTTDTFLYAVDVGTDHAKLPIYLLQNGICESVIATDINKGPLLRALKNIEEHLEKELQERISLVHTDGLCGLCAEKINRVMISGMGGELIINILKNAPEGFFKNPNINFILQPQKNIELVREFLYSSGYRILDEKLVKEQGRIYPVILTRFENLQKSANELELYLGEHIMKMRDEVFLEYFALLYSNIKKSYTKKKLASQLTEKESLLYERFTEFKTKEGL